MSAPLPIETIIERCQAMEAEVSPGALAEARFEAGLRVMDGVVQWYHPTGVADRYYAELLGQLNAAAAEARMKVYREEGHAAYLALGKRMSRWPS